MTTDDERIALFLDYENLAIGARDLMAGGVLQFRPIADALAERGRVVVRRAYADWSRFDEDRRELTRHHVELIEIPQRMGLVRKNAADIKMAVDAVELSFERDYITTFVLGTGDSDFTPLVHKLRELNKRVIGIGIEASTSALLPPACDEFLFYERLDGVELATPKKKKTTRSTTKSTSKRVPEPADTGDEPALVQPSDTDLDRLVTQTLAGLERGTSGPVVASTLKRTILRKDPTFNETTYGFRGFLELLRHLESLGVIALSEGTNQGDPAITLAGETEDEDKAFEALGRIVAKATAKSGPQPLSGLKTQLRRSIPGFSEKRFGYGGFLQFAKAARARGVIELDFDDEVGDYVVRPGSAATP
ncbi:MAG TPA: NYN domain-containing protein [Acidimicrobiia bacterium]|nr:NYN domain-containing protein [Acidimicrobiia bacterium]